MCELKHFEQHVQEKIQSGCSALSCIDIVSNEMYEQLKKYSLGILQNGKRSADILLLYTLVQYTMRDYAGSELVREFCKAINYPYHEQVTDGLFRDIIRNTILRYQLSDFGCFQVKILAISCVKAHAFCDQGKLNLIFDAAQKIHEWLGFDIQDKAKAEQALSDIQKVMRRALESSTGSDNEIINIQFEEDSNHEIPNLRLLKSTTRFFAYSTISTIMTVFFPILQLVDNFYYKYDPTPIPKNRITWLQNAFEIWKDEQQDKEFKKAGTNRATKAYRNRTPYFHISKSTTATGFDLIIPPFMEHAPQNPNNKWMIRVSGKNSTKESELIIALTRHFGGGEYWQTRQHTFPLEWDNLFSDISIEIFSKDEADDNMVLTSWQIGCKRYHLFNSDGDEIKSLRKEQLNILFIEPGTAIEWKAATVFQTNDTQWFSQITVSPEENAICKIGDEGEVLSIQGVCHYTPYFSEEIKKYIAFNIQTNQQVIVSQCHPLISVNCDKSENNSALIQLYKGSTPRRLNVDCYTEIADPDKDDLCIRSFDLQRMIFEVSDTAEIESAERDVEDGIYTVKYQEAGKWKEFTYLLLNGWHIRFPKDRFKTPIGYWEIRTDYQFEPVSDDSLLRFDRSVSDHDSIWDKYELEIRPDCRDVRFKLSDLGVIISCPIKKAIFGFDQEERNAFFHRQFPSVPITDVKYTLYVTMSGASEMSLDQGEYSVGGSRLNGWYDDRFQFDLTDFWNRAKSESVPSGIKLFYSDNIENRSAFIPISTAQGNFQTVDGITYYQLSDLSLNSSIILRFFLKNDNQRDFTYKAIGSYKIGPLASNKTYWYQRYIELPGIKKPLALDKERRPYIQYNLSDLVGVQTVLYSNIYVCDYTIRITGKENGLYTGIMYQDKQPKWYICLMDITESKNILKARIGALSQNDHSYHALVCDKNTGLLFINPYREPTNHNFTFDKTKFTRFKIAEKTEEN